MQAHRQGIPQSLGLAALNSCALFERHRRRRDGGTTTELVGERDLSFVQPRA